MYRDGTGVPPWKEHFGGFAPSQPTGEGAVSQATAGWELNSSFFKLDQSRQGFSSSVLQETEGRDTVCHICTCGRPLDSPPSYTNNCSKWKGSREITLNNRKLLSTMCFQKKVMIYSFCPQCLGKGVRDLEDN